MKIIRPFLGLATLAILAAGCANLKRTEQANGLGDAVLLLLGQTSPNVAPIQIPPFQPAEIYGVRAVPDRDFILVYGSIVRFGQWDVSTRSWHIRVSVLDADGQIIESETAKFFPSPVPYSSSRHRSRSVFFARINKISIKGATIRVILEHNPQ